MSKRVLIVVVLIMLCVVDTLAQSRRNVFTSHDGAIQLEVPRGWRFGTISPNPRTDNPASFEAPTAYHVTLLRSQPSVEIMLAFVDLHEMPEENQNAAGLLEGLLDFEPSLLLEGETLTIAGQEAYRNLMQGYPNAPAQLSEHIIIDEPQTVYFVNIHPGWVLFATWQPQDDSIDITEDLLAILETIRFNGVTRTITTLGGDINLSLPDGWYRNRNVIDRNGNEELTILRDTSTGLWGASIEILPSDTRNYDFPTEDASLEDYLEAYITGLSNQEFNILAIEYLDTTPQTLLAQVENDSTQFISLMRLDDGRIIVMQFMGEEGNPGAAHGDFLEIINNVTITSAE